MLGLTSILLSCEPDPAPNNSPQRQLPTNLTVEKSINAPGNPCPNPGTGCLLPMPTLTVERMNAKLAQFALYNNEDSLGIYFTNHSMYDTLFSGIDRVYGMRDSLILGSYKADFIYKNTIGIYRNRSNENISTDVPDSLIYMVFVNTDGFIL